MVAPKYPKQYDDIQDTTPPYLPTISGNTSIQDYISRLKASLIAVERELGINPSGAQTTVSARLDLIEGKNCSCDGVDEYIPFSTTTEIPETGSVVYVRKDGYEINGVAATALADADGYTEERCIAVGVATSLVDYVRTKGQIEINCTTIIYAESEVFLSSTDEGCVTATAPTAGGEAVVFIGVAKDDSIAGKCNVTLNIDRPDYIASTGYDKGVTITSPFEGEPFLQPNLINVVGVITSPSHVVSLDISYGLVAGIGEAFDAGTGVFNSTSFISNQLHTLITVDVHYDDLTTTTAYRNVLVMAA